jgi:hypothetical protein
MTRKQQKPRDVIADALNDVPDSCFEEYHSKPEICVSGLGRADGRPVHTQAAGISRL